MNKNITTRVAEILQNEQIDERLVVDSESGHLIVKDVFVSTGYSITKHSVLDFLVVLEVVNEEGNTSYMCIEEFRNKKVNDSKTCDECGSKQIFSYDRTGTVVCEDCYKEFTGDKFDNKLNSMVKDITEAVETGEFSERDMARWRITEWYLDEIGVETVHNNINISDEGVHLEEYETDTMTRERFSEVLALEKLRKYDKVNQ